VDEVVAEVEVKLAVGVLLAAVHVLLLKVVFEHMVLVIL